MREEGTFLSTMPPGRDEKRLALAVVVVSSLAFLVAALFATLPLAPVAAFIPAYEAALTINDVITAVLLLGQATLQRSRALVVLACGYLFTALMVVPHALTFPGLFSPTGLLGAGPQSTAWLYMGWHAGFPLLVIAYVMLKGQDREHGPRDGSMRGASGDQAVREVELADACRLAGRLVEVRQLFRYRRQDAQRAGGGGHGIGAAGRQRCGHRRLQRPCPPTQAADRCIAVPLHSLGVLAPWGSRGPHSGARTRLRTEAGPQSRLQHDGWRRGATLGLPSVEGLPLLYPAVLSVLRTRPSRCQRPLPLAGLVGLIGGRVALARAAPRLLPPPRRVAHHCSSGLPRCLPGPVSIMGGGAIGAKAGREMSDLPCDSW
jgi:hypothetical protein